MVSKWKERIPDWDEPSPDNDVIASKFQHEIYENGNITIPYRLFAPKQCGKVPLVLFLHGADVTGTDNEVHLRAHDIGTMFARNEWQREHPCYILAPQYRNGIHWSRPKVMENLVTLIGELEVKYPDIDDERIYLYGYSAGGIGGLKMMKTYPGLFKKALILCAATSREDMEKLADTPFWLFHAPEDEFVAIGEMIQGYSQGHLGSSVIYDIMKDEMGDKIRYTEYAPGEMKDKYHVNPHAVWVPVTRDEAAKQWLFE